MPGTSWMTREQSVWLKSKLDGFRLSQLQGEVATYLTNTNREWFEKWPEITAHFKDDRSTGLSLTEDQLTQEQIDCLGHHIKQRQSVSVSYLQIHFGSLIITRTANMFLYVPRCLLYWKNTGYAIHQNNYEVDGFDQSYSWAVSSGTLSSYSVQGQS
jgi:hypothetical protein